MNRETLERQIMVMEELAARRATDPWWQWQPHARQVPFIRAVLSQQTGEAWMIAANRSGKSDPAAWLAAGLARFGWAVPRFGPAKLPPFRPTKGWVISATGGASKTIIQPKIHGRWGTGGVGSHLPFIPDREIADFNKNDELLLLKNGSVVEFKSAEAKTISLAGAGLDWILIDEEIEKAKFDELTIRIEAGKRLVIFGACTLLPPEGQIGGVSWLFPERIKPWKQAGGTESSPPPNWHNHFMLFGASIYDNPHLDPVEITRLESKYPIGSAERQIRLEGLWVAGLQGSRAYTAFEPAIHVRPQPELERRRPICWIWDFNVEPMVSLIGQRHGDLFRIHKELILDEGDLDKMIQWFIETVPYHSSDIWLYGDATGRNRHAAAVGGRSEFQIIVNAMRTYGAPVRLRVPETNPNVPDRINAINTAFRDQQGVSHVEIDPSCVELIADLEGVLRDNTGGIKKTRNRRDPYFRRTHTSDALGYWIAYEAPVRSSSFMERVVTAIKQPGYAFGRRT